MRIRKQRESLYHWRFPDPQILLKRQNPVFSPAPEFLSSERVYFPRDCRAPIWWRKPTPRPEEKDLVNLPRNPPAGYAFEAIAKSTITEDDRSWSVW